MSRALYHALFAVCCAAALLLGPLTTPRLVASAHADASGPSLSDQQSALDASTAAAIASAYDHAVVVSSDTTPTSEVQANPDGSFQLTQDSLPVRAESDGAWAPLNLDLQLTDSGYLQPANAAVPVRFSGGGDSPLAQVQGTDGSWVAEHWTSGQLPTPTIDGATATYSDALPGVDLKLTATPTGVSEVFVVKDQQAADDPPLDALKLAVTGTTLQPAPDTAVDGSAAIITPDGLSSPAPSWWDSSTPDANAEGPGATGDTQPVQNEVTSDAETLNVSDTLSGSDVHYPVYVDPDTTLSQNSRTYVDNAYPAQSYFDGSGAPDNKQHVGYIDAAESDDGKAHLTRSYWNMRTGAIDGTDVTAAHFNVTDTNSYSCNATDVQLWRTGAISASTNWNNHPNDLEFLDHKAFADGYSSSCPANSEGFDATKAAQEAANNGWDSVTLGLEAANESNPAAWKKFAATATLTVTYWPIPTTPHSLNVEPCWAACGSPTTTWSQTPELDAQSTGGTDNLNYHFQIVQSGPAWNNDAPAENIDKVSRQSGVLVATNPSDYVHDLAAGDSYFMYRVNACDTGHDSTCSGWSSWAHFIVDNSDPLKPQVTPPNASGQFGKAMTVTFAPNANLDSQEIDQIYGYAYSWHDNPPTYQRTDQGDVPSNNSDNNGVFFKTANTSDKSVDAQVVPEGDVTSTLYVWALTKAGVETSNENDFAIHTTDASIANGHSWDTDTGVGADCVNGPVADTQTTNGTLLRLGPLGDGVCWQNDGTVDPGAPNDTSHGAIHLTANSPIVHTDDPAVDTTKSYTVAGWVDSSVDNSATAPNGVARTALAESGSDHWAFILRLGSDNKYKFCVQDQTGSPQQLCAERGGDTGSVTAHSWTFITGEYDNANDEIRLYINGNLVNTEHYIPPAGNASATSGLTIGSMTVNGAASGQFLGQILDPVAIQGLASPNQLSGLMALRSPTQLG